MFAGVLGGVVSVPSRQGVGQLAKRSDVPKLSIGIPVYNGDKYIAVALDSILSQTFTDFELIVSDNASADRTAEICEEYAARDKRIQFVRNPKNLGAAANYNRVFSLARAEYFKWHAHDDVLAPEFLERCIAALDADPDAVLCRTLVTLIDADGEEVGIYDPGLRSADSPRPSDRFAAIILPAHMGTDFFGIFRRKALESTPLHGTYHGSDQVLLAVLALRGRFIQISEPLFMNRSHPDRYSDGVRIQDRGTWHDTSGTKRTRFPLWKQYAEYGREVRRQLPDRRDRLRCYGHMVHWWFRNWNLLRMVVDVVVAYYPRAFDLARAVKRRLIGLNDAVDWHRWRGDPK